MNKKNAPNPICERCEYWENLCKFDGECPYNPCNLNENNEEVEMELEEKHSFPDCLDYLSEKTNTSYDDYHIHETLICNLCGKKVVWKYRLLGIFDEKDNLIKETSRGKP